MHWTHDLELLFFGQNYGQVAKMLSPLTCNQCFLFFFLYNSQQIMNKLSYLWFMHGYYYYYHLFTLHIVIIFNYVS
jgi:hypothetical protein